MIMIQYRLGKVLVSKIRIYIVSTVVSRITDGGMPRCREFSYILFPQS